jgi:histidine ammonia-lyase
MSSPLNLDGHSLKIAEVVEVARQARPAALAPEAKTRMVASRAYVESLLRPDAPPVYGINTGFGIFSNRPVSPEDSEQLSRNLILSHAVATGEPFAVEVTRAALLIRANTLALGHSGIRPEIVETILAMLNAGVTPVVPQQGSLGSSGDLSPLCHLALVFSTDARDEESESGRAILNGQEMSGKAAMAAVNLPRLILGAKESLALINGATFSAAVAALAAHDARNLIRHAELGTALALEALLGVSGAFDERLHNVRKHAGQWEAATRIRNLISGSTFVDASGRVQDAYSLRCAPQVFGPALDTLRFVEHWINAEINAATDNPLIFSDPDGAMRAISGGNFHGEVMALGMDFLGIALAEVGAILERQINRLVNHNYSHGLPPMLVSSPEAAGVNSGLMMPHYTAVSLVLENQTLAHPDSVHSLPTSAGQEDHNANALTAARHAQQIIHNVGQVAAIHFFTAAQAIDLRRAAQPDLRLSPAAAAAHAAIRQIVPFVDRDRLYQPDLTQIAELVRAGALL